MSAIGRLASKAAWRFHRSAVGRAAFDALQAAGLHVVPNHFYLPIPDTRTIDPASFDVDSALRGVDMREPAQVAMIEELAAGYRSEYERLPRTKTDAASDEFHLDNPFFESVDAEVLFAMVRHLKPQRVVEVGSGFSTLLILRAGDLNRAEGRPLRLRSIEPYPRPFLLRLASTGAIELVQEPVEKVGLDRFGDLRAGDVLFIDSTHSLRIGGDVQREFLEIIPRLAAGVHVHVHDIFLPREYPREWVLRNHWFWTEQYMLQAFLAFNTEFEVVLALAYLHRRHPELLSRLIPSYDPAVVSPGSFWMRRRMTDGTSQAAPDAATVKQQPR